MQYMEVCTRTLDRDVHGLKEGATAVKNQLDQLYNDIQALNGMWEGAANRVFVQQFAQDFQTMLSLIKMLEQYIQLLATAGESYTKCENKIHRSIDNIRI